ncbi:MAG: tRNA (adenosine(37)-N6)-dimethylallyltransferase MiaA [bacterium]
MNEMALLTKDTAIMSAFFLVGPTATGKSAVAQRLAEDDQFDIVSADSMLVYRGMDLGTAKPTCEDRARARYWCMDLVDAGSLFSVGLFRNSALAAISQIAMSGRKAIVAGGTGLYIKALTHGLSQTPPADPVFRAELDRIAGSQPVAELQSMLNKLAPELYNALSDKLNPRRLVRALELAHTGIRQPPASWKHENTGPMITGLRLDPAQLKMRIVQRARNMFKTGLIDEVKVLLAAGFGQSPTARSAIGYTEAIALLNGSLTEEDAVQQTARRTFQLARRQMTWFRHQANVDWIDIDIGMDAATIAGAVKESWRKHGPAPIVR